MLRSNHYTGWVTPRYRSRRKSGLTNRRSVGSWAGLHLVPTGLGPRRNTPISAATYRRWCRCWIGARPCAASAQLHEAAVLHRTSVDVDYPQVPGPAHDHCGRCLQLVVLFVNSTEAGVETVADPTSNTTTQQEENRYRPGENREHAPHQRAPGRGARP